MNSANSANLKKLESPVDHVRTGTLGISLLCREASGAGETGRAQREHVQRDNCANHELIATLSHELRTPLNAMLGWTRLLRSGELDAPAAANALEVIERNAIAQARLVDDLLDISRMARGQLGLDVCSVDLASVVEAAMDTVRPTAVGRNIAITAMLTPCVRRVAGDPLRLQQVVWNLLSNAIKFTPAGGRIQVKLEERADAMSLEGTDTGSGIAPEFLPHVFEQFRQGESGSTRAQGGLGIGLAIVRHLVEAHGGIASAESAGQGKGARFTVRLPLEAPPPRDRVTHVATAAPAPGAAPRKLPSLVGLRVLVVDDDEDAREVARESLEHAGAQVTTAASARAALALVESARADVIVSDIGMPAEDGIWLIRKIRELGAQRGGSVPAAALTAFTEREDRRETLLAGYQTHLAKPVDPSGLIAAMAKLAGRA